MCAHSFNVKQLYMIHRYDHIKCNHSGPKWTWEQWQWMGTPHSPKLQHYWSLTIRLSSVISRALVWSGVLPLCWDTIGVFYNPSRLGYRSMEVNSIFHDVSCKLNWKLLYSNFPCLSILTIWCLKIYLWYAIFICPKRKNTKSPEAGDVTVILENGQDDLSSNSERNYLRFTFR